MKTSQPSSTGERGVALILVLAFLVLLAGLVVAYLGRTSTTRQLAHGTFSEGRADVLARSALDIVVGDLKQEIVLGSVSPAPTFGPSSSPRRVYIPSKDTYLLPTPDGTPSNGSIPSLIKRSVRNDNPGVPGVGSRASAASSRDDPSVNGRYVSGERWNQHYLIPRVTPTPSTDISTPTSDFTPPDWVFVTSAGPTPISTPASSTIGRYAYAVYDEAALLDANVAGYPSPSPSPVPVNYIQAVGRKGGASFADLSAAQFSYGAIDDLVGWRSYASVQPAGSFGNFAFDVNAASRFLTAVLTNTSGFMTVSGTVVNGATDQMFAGRQSWLQYRSQNTVSVTANQYVGTFSRELTVPSWSPDYDASTRGGSSATAYAYKANASTPTAINRDFRTVRVTSSSGFSRFDGSVTAFGDPLVGRRFPLSRLAWITYKGPSASVYATDNNDPVVIALLGAGVPLSTIQAGTAANIKTCFGLVWDSRSYVATALTNSGQGQQWVYTSPNVNNGGGTFDPATAPSGTAAAAIKTLQTVQLENREPDFFELLQACILTGSLGQNTGGGTVKTSGGAAEVPAVFPDIHMSNTMHHILSIGAAIIDQADPDSFPTRIRMDQPTGSWLALGVENLPYITEMCPVGGVSSDNPMQWASYALFQLWNPNENASTTQPATRLRVDGGIGIFNGNGNTWNPGSTSYYVASAISTVLSNNSAFSTTAAPITSANVTASGSTVGTFVPVPAYASSQQYVGFRLPDFTMPAGTTSAPPQLWWQVGATIGATVNPFNASMEVNINGTYVPYNYFVGMNATNSWISNNPMFVRASAGAAGTPVAFTASPDSATKVPQCLMKADPRSTRFGVFQIDTNASTTPASHARIDSPLWEPSNSKLLYGFGGVIGTDVEHVPITFNGSNPYYPATLCINTAASSSTATGYKEIDGVQRIGDAAYRSNTTKNNPSTPYDIASLQYRPVILNRPFRNVGELGYAFRDLPWKSLDFFSANSGDAGLLDVFSATDEAAIVAGRVNLNCRQAPVIQAVMQSALWDEYDPTNLVGTSGSSTFSDAKTMGTNYTHYITTNGYLSNRSSLTSALSGTTPFTTAVLQPGIGNDDQNEGAKTRREAVVRSVASAGQTRTWNLLIDVIAQSGRYPPTVTANPVAGDLPKFVVEGEKRYWLHVAIDRFTGEVIDQQLEAVYE